MRVSFRFRNFGVKLILDRIQHRQVLFRISEKSLKMELSGSSKFEIPEFENLNQVEKNRLLKLREQYRDEFRNLKIQSNLRRKRIYLNHE